MCELRGRESRGARERTGGPASFIHTSQYWGSWGQPWRRSPACLPTSNDQILQGGPGIGEIPLLACVPERGWNPVLVGQDLAVLEGSRHCWDCRWGLGREPGCWALREQKALPVPPLLSSRLSPGGLSGTRREDRHRQQWVGGWPARFLLSEERAVLSPEGPSGQPPSPPGISEPCPRWQGLRSSQPRVG